ncbi:MAG TPA: UpxY family transcription antiterminator [Bryobacteraceae bacterium]|nr:UpxY family transcription antiterminator [Bryobacteraceae bacterium]
MTSPAPAPACLAWYGLRTKSRFEKVAAAALAGKGYEHYLPCHRTRRQWSDRLIEIESPLFPGYVFCRLDIHQRLPVLTIPGVVSVVGIGRTPSPIPDVEIAAIETVLASGLLSEPWPYLPQGRRIRIEKGSLSGVEGVVVEHRKSEWRLVVSINILQRSVAVELDREWVAPIQ